MIIAQWENDEELYDAAIEADEESFPASVVDALLEGGNPIKVYRQHRGLLQEELAAQFEIDTVYLSQIETGAREVPLPLRRKIAVALSVDLDDLEA